MKPETVQKMFNSPQPGQSLTAEPGSRPWEQPPQFVNPDDAFIYVMDRMAKKENVTQMLNLLDKGVSVNAVTEMVLQSGVMNGKWSPDLAMILAEPTATLIMRTARDAGVKYKTRPKDPNYNQMRTAGRMEKLPPPAPEVQEGLKQAAAQENAPKGIMSRRGKK